MAGINPLRTAVSASPAGGGGFNRLATGKKRYGSGRPMPNFGKVDNAPAAAGYNQRDVRLEALRRRAGGI